MRVYGAETGRLKRDDTGADLSAIPPWVDRPAHPQRRAQVFHLMDQFGDAVTAGFLADAAELGVDRVHGDVVRPGVHFERHA